MILWLFDELHVYTFIAVLKFYFLTISTFLMLENNLEDFLLPSLKLETINLVYLSYDLASNLH